MIDYTTVSKSTVPIKTIMPHGKWLEILNNLSMDNCLKFNLDSVKRANSVRSSIQGCLRKARTKKLNIHYKVRGQTIRNPNKTYTLYVWKEKEDK